MEVCTTKEDDPDAIYLKIKITKIDETKQLVLVDNRSDDIKTKQKLRIQQEEFDRSCDILLDEFKSPMNLLQEEFNDSRQSSGSLTDSPDFRNT